MTRQASLFKGRVVIVVVVVYANDCVTARKQAQCESGTNKTSRAGDEDFHLIISEQIAAVDFVCYITQIIRHSVGNNDICFLFELS